MMKIYRNNGLKRTVSLLMTTVMVLSLFVITATNSFAAPEIPKANSSPRHVVCKSLSEAAKDYYTGEYSYENLSKLEGAEDISSSYNAAQNNDLYDALQALMSDTQIYNASYSGYKSGSLAYYWTSTDAVSGGETYVMFYSDITAGEEGITLNREHIWPKSNASFHTKNGGSDLHHLRPSISTLNNAKSNHFFGYINGKYERGYKTGIIGGEELYYVKSDSDVFECKDDVKGDVARILLYVYCRWGQPNLYSDIEEALLPSPDPDDTVNNGVRAIEDLDTLLLWCELDPVDSWEMERNDITERIQGNRNVFIDYPELVWQLFGLEIPVGMQTPTKEGCKHVFKETERNKATCTQEGSFTEECEKCGNCHTRELAINNNHTDKDNNGYCDDCYKDIKTGEKMQYPADVSSNIWYGESVLFNLARGYMNGTGGGLFSPDMNFTRAQFVQLLANIENADLSGYKTSSFADVTPDRWYCAAVNWAYKKGYTQGTGNGTFSPDRAVTREEIAKFFCNYSEKKGYDIFPGAPLDKYSDAGEISIWARESFSWAVTNGLITGTTPTALSPKSTSTRSQVSVITMRFAKAYFI